MTLAALVAIWGSSFTFIKRGLASVPAGTLVAGRVFLGAAILLAVAYLRGGRLSALTRNNLRFWGNYLILALLGNCIPFTTITWG